MGNSKGKLADAVQAGATSREAVKSAFDAYDKDHSGTIDTREAVSFGKDLLKILCEATGCTKPEILGRKQELDWIDDEFKAMDSNGDGFISFEEFERYIFETYQITFSKDNAQGYRGMSARSKSLFGGVLELHIARSPYTVPELMHNCVSFIRENGLQEPGIFRVGGRQQVLSKLVESYEKGEKVPFENVHDAAGLLKQYLRSLREPLVPFDHYRSFIDLAKAKRLNKSSVSELLQKLPRPHFDALAFLMTFLHEVSQNQEENKMTEKNLAIVMAPNLLRPAVEAPESMIAEAGHSSDVIAFMITECPDLFPPRPSSYRRGSVDLKWVKSTSPRSSPSKSLSRGSSNSSLGKGRSRKSIA